MSVNGGNQDANSDPGGDPRRRPRGDNGEGAETPSSAGGAEWLRGAGEASDVVMSSRVRFARNLAGHPFMTRAGREEREAVLELCREAILQSKLAPQVMWMELHKAPRNDRAVLVERHLISQQHSRGKLSDGSGGLDEPRGVASTVPDERLAIMVNEEDHLRIQVIRSGLSFEDALAEIDQADDKLEARLDYAFSPRFGYLTACPTNVGTGARLSAMIHLPALRMTGELDKVKRAAQDMSLAVRGFYGEGSEAAGDFYQISNQTTLGKSEQVLMHELGHEILPQVIEYERTARGKLLRKQRTIVEDQVHRAVGVLTHARLLTTEEAMELLSQVRLGIVSGIIRGSDLADVNRLMLLVQPAHLQQIVGKDLTQEQRREARATLMRSRLTKVAGGK
jgi:protein arginine kinase